MTTEYRIPLTLFLLTAFPIHAYSYYNSFREFPAWLARLDTGDLVRTVALTQLFTLLETLIVFVPLALLLWFLPKREVLATLLLTLAAVWAIAAHLYIEALRDWGMREYAVAAVIFLTIAAAMLWIGVRNKRVQAVVTALNERIVVLSGLYILVDVIGLIVLVVML